jgi:CubicO group peptidase (beta-lactamase class C family)
MNFEDLEKAWREDRSHPSQTLSEEALLPEIRRKRECFRRTIFWRDVRELGITALLIPFFIHGGLKIHWALHLCAFGCAVVGAFMLLDRRRQRKKTPDPHSALSDCATAALAEVCHQIWLLKNVLWWYLLPLAVPMLVFFAFSSANLPGPAPLQVFGFLVISGIVAGIYAGIYWLNQLAVKKDLEPCRQELAKLLAELEPNTPPPLMKTHKPLAPLILVIVVCGLSLLDAFGRLITQNEDVRPSASASDPTSQLLEAIRLKHRFPALAAAVVVDGKVVTTNAVGFRKHGGDEAATPLDKFHIGSVTKSMTATIAAMLVEQGKIDWTTTVGEALAKDANPIYPDYRGVTLEQLLAHRGGAPANAPRDLWRQAWKAVGTPAEQRREFVRGLLARKPETTPGTKMVYSNQGYAIAGVMLEQVTGKPWEELMRTMLFKPLEMTSAGFGAPAKPGEIDQPWGHTRSLTAGITPKPPGPGADNPAAIGPAGTVHCSLPDLAKYALFHLAGERDGTDLLKPASFRKLHTAVGDKYALGWMVVERPWAGGRALTHTGSNTMFFVVIWLAPERNCAVIVATNIGGPEAAFRGCDEAAGKLIRQYFPK